MYLRYVSRNTSGVELSSPREWGSGPSVALAKEGSKGLRPQAAKGGRTRLAHNAAHAAPLRLAALRRSTSPWNGEERSALASYTVSAARISRSSP